MYESYLFCITLLIDFFCQGYHPGTHPATFQHRGRKKGCTLYKRPSKNTGRGHLPNKGATLSRDR